MENLCRLENGGGVLLWENPNPDADFAEQTITLVSGDYEYLVVEESVYFNTYASRRIAFVPDKSIYRDEHTIKTSAQVYGVIRTWTFDNKTSVRVGNASLKYAGGSQTTDNACLVPRRIYGYKR